MEWTRTEKDIFRLAVFSSSSSLMCLPNGGVLGEVSKFFFFFCLCVSLAVLWQQVCKYHPDEREVGSTCGGTQTPLIHPPPPLVFAQLRHWSWLICSSSTSPDTHLLSALCSPGATHYNSGSVLASFFAKCPAGARADSWTQIHRFADSDYGPVGTQCCHLFVKRAQ